MPSIAILTETFSMGEGKTQRIDRAVDPPAIDRVRPDRVGGDQDQRRERLRGVGFLAEQQPREFR